MASRPKQRQSGETPSGPIGCYTLVLLVAVFMATGLLIVLPNLLTTLNLTVLLPVLDVLLAALYSWLLAGLGVCLLLSLWLKNRAVATILTLLLGLIWVAVFTRYVQGEGLFPKVLVILLTLGIPALPALWFSRPLEGMLTLTMSSGWLLLWLLLFIRLKEYMAGVILLLSLATTGAVFIGGIYIASGFLLPLSERRHWRTIFNFLRDFAIGVNFPAYVVVDELYEEDKVENRIPGNPFGEITSSPGFVLSGCDHAVAISSGIKFKGVHGPGVTFMRFGDQVVQTIDLRPQLRAFTVDALTKDGIKIKVLAFTPCKIDSRGRKPTLGEPLPYNKSAAFKAVHAQRTEHGGNQTKLRAWYDLPRMIAERTLQNIISAYNFDDLYGPYQPGGVPLRKIIANRFYEQVAAELEPLGIQLIGGGISDLQPADPQVYVKRVRSWQTEWTRKITLKQAEGQAEWLRIVERARAEVQTDLIMSLGRQLDELSRTRAEFRPERILKQAVIVLDQLSGQATMKGALPDETVQGIIQIREAFTE